MQKDLYTRKCTSTVGSIIRKFKEYGTTANLPKSGAPRKIGLPSHRYLLKNI